MRNSFQLSVVLCVALLSLTTQPVLAANKTWNGSTTGSWQIASN